MRWQYSQNFSQPWLHFFLIQRGKIPNLSHATQPGRQDQGNEPRRHSTGRVPQSTDLVQGAGGAYLCHTTCCLRLAHCVSCVCRLLGAGGHEHGAAEGATLATIGTDGVGTSAKRVDDAKLVDDGLRCFKLPGLPLILKSNDA